MSGRHVGVMSITLFNNMVPYVSVFCLRSAGVPLWRCMAGVAYAVLYAVDLVLVLGLCVPRALFIPIHVYFSLFWREEWG